MIRNAIAQIRGGLKVLYLVFVLVRARLDMGYSLMYALEVTIEELNRRIQDPEPGKEKP